MRAGEVPVPLYGVEGLNGGGLVDGTTIGAEAAPQKVLPKVVLPQFAFDRSGRQPDEMSSFSWSFVSWSSGT